MVLRGGEVLGFFVLRDVEDSVFKGEFWNTGEGREDWAVSLFLKHARARRAGFLFGGYGKSMCLMVEFSTSSNFMFQSVPGADNRV